MPRSRRHWPPISGSMPPRPGCSRQSTSWSFGLTQIPIGVLLDRLAASSPRRAAGHRGWRRNAVRYRVDFPELLVARAMIGLGVAGSLMAGLKAIVTWFPRERVALANGWMIMLGSLGAVTATAPTDWLLNYIGWRSLFEILTIGTVTAGGLIYMVVPERIVDSRDRHLRSKATYVVVHLFRSAFPESRSALGRLYWLVLGAAVIVGCSLAYRRGRIRPPQPSRSNVPDGCWPKPWSPPAGCHGRSPAQT